MKRWKLAMVVFALCSASVGCKDEPPPAYPFQRVITNTEGKEIEVTVVGRNQTALIFKRSGDEKRFEYPIANLSRKDRKFAESLPVQVFKQESAWIRSKREELRRIEERIDSYEAQLRGADGGSMRARSLKREITKLEDAKKKLEQSIKDDLAAGR